MFRRFAVIALSVSMLSATIPAPASALSTPTEIQIGKEYDKQITDQSVIVTDPLLNQWVNDISNKLWAQTARKDIPYSIKIIDESDINAFSTLGGYIYINEGTLDFVQSDDELAGVIGHETGHIERRHAVTANNKASILNVLFGVASLFIPLVYRFGQLAEAGMMARISRDDENEADKYGLMLMARAGYDPDAMRTFMAHLGAVEKDSHDVLSKYLADHPGTDKRLANLNGDPELNPTLRTDDQRIAQATHDYDTARYNIAAMKFTDVLSRRPDDSTARFQLGQSQLALGQVSKGEQNLAAAAERVSPEAKSLADVRIKALRDAERRLDLLHPDLSPLRDQLATAQTQQTQAATAIALRRQQGIDQLKSLKTRIEDIVYGMPDFSRVQPRKDSRLDTLLHNVNLMGKSLDEAISKSTETISGVGSLERNKEGGLLKENSDILTELGAPLKLDNPPPQSLATFPAYPKMLTSVGAADADMVRGVDAARASLAILDLGLGDLNVFVNELRRVSLDGTGDVTLSDYHRIEPLVTKAVDSLNKAAVGATQASQLYNMARARQLQTRIDMLGVQESPDRYATFQHALDVRFHVKGPDYDDLARQDLTPGDVAAAVIIGADTNAAAPAVLAEAKADGKPLVDLANSRGMYAQCLEIFLGLIYLDYTDDPNKEARGDLGREVQGAPS
ncbi:MAG TPA: M48 family metalloprotease [Candidatus Elarobacter sp.]|jgi:predicted Zn-dependent protease|nr:M48 family metalloprotease [Candidatus Elarobacter sp.]